MEHKWVHSSAYSSLPPNAVVGGNDADGDMLYVGRSFHNGDLLPAKVVPNKQIAFVSWRGEELPKDHFEVLCGTRLAWRHCYDHVIPENAVLCGSTAVGQPIYVGRGHYEGSLTVGKVSSVHRALFIPFGGAERRLESYEILVEEPEKREPGWSVPTPTSPLPPPLEEKPLHGSLPPPPSYWEKPPCPYPTEESKPHGLPPAYSPMPQPQPSWGPTPPPPPFGAGPQTPSYTPGPCYKPATSYTPGPNYTPATSYVPESNYTPAATYVPPPPPPPCEVAPPVFVPPSHSASRDMWVNASASYSPANAVHAGHDADLGPIHVGRAFHNGDLIPGKVVPGRGCAYVAYGGQEVHKPLFEVLVGEGYHWVPASDGHVPPGAVEGGRTSAGEPLFVGRAPFCGSLTPGKVQRSHRCLYIAYRGREERLGNYEVLVRRGDFYHDQAMKMLY